MLAGQLGREGSPVGGGAGLGFRLAVTWRAVRCRVPCGNAVLSPADGRLAGLVPAGSYILTGLVGYGGR
jgi:hypothetical protein